MGHLDAHSFTLRFFKRRGKQILRVVIHFCKKEAMLLLALRWCLHIFQSPEGVYFASQCYFFDGSTVHGLLFEIRMRVIVHRPDLEFSLLSSFSSSSSLLSISAIIKGPNVFLFIHFCPPGESRRMSSSFYVHRYVGFYKAAPIPP